jgi:glutaredoxin
VVVVGKLGLPVIFVDEIKHSGIYTSIHKFNKPMEI